MDGVVPPYHARLAGACLPDGDPALGQPARKRGTNDCLPLTVPEVRRLLLALVDPPDRFGFHVAWSTFRRRHQAMAKRGHVARRAQKQPPGDGRPSIQVLPGGDFVLTDERWARIAPLLPPQKPATGRPNYDHRTILAGIFWVVQTGVPWRELPVSFGPWHAVYGRYQRWRRTGIWQQILDTLKSNASPDTP